ncbi:MAG: DoxX family membrane protein [Spirosomataceae bacterium]
MTLDYTLLKIAQVLVTLFLGVLFVQSGFDKVLDSRNNIAYIQSVFSKTFLRPIATLLMLFITFFEVVSGVLAIGGAVLYFQTGQKDVAILAVEMSAITLLFLFTGQRIAKDYGGAAALVPYFLTTLVGLFLFSLH